MSNKDEIIPKLFDYSQPPSKLYSYFSTYFKPILDITPANRISCKKLSQAYCPTLVSILKYTNQELNKKSSEKFQDYLLDLMQNSLIQLSKLFHYFFEKLSDYYTLWYILAAKLNDLGKFSESLKISQMIVNDLENSEFFQIRVNFYLIISNCLLQIDPNKISSLEKVYDLLAIKTRNILFEHKGDFDGHGLNKVHLSVFKVLMRTGKMLDNLAAGNMTLHEQALMIRTTALKFLEKTKPLIISDYIAFVYSSIITTYKFATSFNSLNLLSHCIEGIDETVTPIEPLTEPDKNYRSLIELKALILIKLEKFSNIKQTLIVLMTNTDNLVGLLYDIKYQLEIVRSQFQGNLEVIVDLEELVKKLQFFFDCKLTMPSVLKTSDLSELKELAPKVLNQFDNWIKVLAMINSPATVKAGGVKCVATLRVMLESAKYLVKMVRFQEKLGVSVGIELAVFNYMMLVNYALLYAQTKDPSFANLLIPHCSQFSSKTSFKYFPNLYNLCLNLINSDEKELSLKILTTLLDTSSTIHETILPLAELLSKHSTEPNITKHSKRILFNLFNKLSENEKTSALGLKLVEIICVVQCKEYYQTGQLFSVFEGMSELSGKILQKEMGVYFKKMVSEGNAGRYLFERIQDIVRQLIFKVYKPWTSEHVEALVSYFEVLASFPSGSYEDKVINEIFSMVSKSPAENSKEKVLTILKEFWKQSKEPILCVWKSVIIMEIIKDQEKINNSLWMTRNSLKLHLSAVKNLEKVASFFSENLKITVKKDFQVVKKPSNYTLTASDVKTLNLASEISKFLNLPKLEFSFLALLYESIDSLQEKDCLEIRKKLCLYHLGSEKQIFFNLPSEEYPVQQFFTACWKEVFHSEFLYFSGKLEKSQMILTKLNQTLTPSHLTFRRAQLIKAYSLYILSNICLTQGNYGGSLSLCKEARELLKEDSLYTHTVHNLSILSSISENLSKELIVYPNTIWSFQSLSFYLTSQLAEIYTRMSMTLNSMILFTHNLKLGKLMGASNLFLYSCSKICSLHRQTSQGLAHDNIKEQLISTMTPNEFVEGIYSNFFEPILQGLDKFYPQKMIECLSKDDIDLLNKVLDREVLCWVLITLGDILQTPIYYASIDIQSAEQSYYKLSNYLLSTPLATAKLQVLKSSISRKLALLSFRQSSKAPPVSSLQTSLSHLICCPKFLQPNCCNDQISPLLYEEISFTILNLCSFLITQSEPLTPYLTYILSLPYTQHPLIVSQSHYFLALNPNQHPAQRTFHILSSIGCAYNTQAFIPQYSTSEEMLNNIESVPENLTIVAISSGKNNFSFGTLIARVEKNREPFCFLANNNCCTGSENLGTFFEEFSRIMQEAGKSVQNDKVVRITAHQWWEKRERLNEKLEKLLESVQSQYFTFVFPMMVGRIADYNIDRLVYFSAKDLVSDFYCSCGQVWDFRLLYCFFTTFLLNILSIESFERILSLTCFVKSKLEIIKKAKNLKKVTEGKSLAQNPVVLVMSGHLLHFPWECLKVFMNTYVTRVLSLQFLIRSLPAPAPDYKRGFFILNPSKDLEKTQKTFEKNFLAHSSWTGVIEEPPTETQFSEALQNQDLVIYCGHSSGEKYLKGEKIRELKVKSVCFLLGCSSGLLKSQGFYEPQGIVVQYSIAGCPGLLANLWDVTDRDIDRFSLELLRKIEMGCSLGSAIYHARNVCKLKYLVGSAPVWYGIPLEFQL